MVLQERPALPEEVPSLGVLELTVMEDESLLPSDVAVIVAVPWTTPVTTPLEETVATAVLLLLQATLRPLRALPEASLGVAVSWVVPPTVTEALEGAISTEATGTDSLR